MMNAPHPEPRVAIHHDFLRAFSALEPGARERVGRLTDRLQKGDEAGMAFEPVAGVADPKVRTLAVGDEHRMVVLRSPRGGVTVCLWVDRGEAALSWARERTFSVNERVGSLQIFRAPPAQASPAPAGGALFGSVPDEALLGAGLPPPLLPSVRAVATREQLEQLAPFLPTDARGALLALAAGGGAEALGEQGGAAAVDADDLGRAVEASGGEIKAIGSLAELEDMLSRPLELWRVYLHSSQRALVEMDASGPVRVTGGPGTGKTVVAMHRARHLTEKVFPSGRVLFTTFTRNLARDIRHQLQGLCGALAGRIDVTNLHQWARAYVQQSGQRVDLADENDRDHAWAQALAGAGALPFEPGFYREEWDKVVQAEDVTDLAGYLKVRRSGRGTALSRQQRAEVWKVFEGYRVALRGRREFADVVRDARRLVVARAEGSKPLYQAVVADEVQDFRPADLRLLRALVGEGRNDLFLVGDAHQRIYGHAASLSARGIETRGRARRLKINYRTTEQIRDWAVKIVADQRFDGDGGDAPESLEGYHSLRLGGRPSVRHFATASAEGQYIVDVVRAFAEKRGPEQVCVVARGGQQVEQYRRLLESAGLETYLVTPERDVDDGDGVRLATMHRVKGLEFPCVVVAGVRDGVTPPASLKQGAVDEAASHDLLDQECRLLFVAATRARDELHVTGYGKPSPLLPAGS